MHIHKVEFGDKSLSPSKKNEMELNLKIYAVIVKAVHSGENIPPAKVQNFFAAK